MTRGQRIRVLLERAARLIANVPIADKGLDRIRPLVAMGLMLDDIALERAFDDNTCVMLASFLDEMEEHLGSAVAASLRDRN